MEARESVVIAAPGQTIYVSLVHCSTFSRLFEDTAARPDDRDESLGGSFRMRPNCDRLFNWLAIWKRRFQTRAKSHENIP